MDTSAQVVTLNSDILEKKELELKQGEIENTQRDLYKLSVEVAKENDKVATELKELAKK